MAGEQAEREVPHSNGNVEEPDVSGYITFEFAAVPTRNEEEAAVPEYVPEESELQGDPGINVEEQDVSFYVPMEFEGVPNLPVGLEDIPRIQDTEDPEDLPNVNIQGLLDALSGHVHTIETQLAIVETAAMPGLRLQVGEAQPANDGGSPQEGMPLMMVGEAQDREAPQPPEGLLDVISEHIIHTIQTRIAEDLEKAAEEEALSESEVEDAPPAIGEGGMPMMVREAQDRQARQLREGLLNVISGHIIHTIQTRIAEEKAAEEAQDEGPETLGNVRRNVDVEPGEGSERGLAIGPGQEAEPMVPAGTTMDTN